MTPLAESLQGAVEMRVDCKAPANEGVGLPGQFMAPASTAGRHIAEVASLGKVIESAPLGQSHATEDCDG